MGFRIPSRSLALRATGPRFPFSLPDMARPLKLLTPALALAALLAPALAPAVAAQPGPGGPGTTSSLPAAGGSAVQAGLLLRQMDGERRVLMIAAHPDDEDTGLLTALARGMGARTAYLSLSRGEGGQNLIGPEMAEGLGLIRTGELLSARTLDGAEQYFTRAFDFGFSKSAEETLTHWPEEALLEDVVRVIRTFRPQILVSVFSGTPRDGHGHHQVAGMMAHQAFFAAAEEGRFPELDAEGLLPWAPDKLYRSAWRDPTGATLAVETGVWDPLLGRSHFQVAMASRSRHRSQDMGVPETPGPRRTLLTLWESRVGDVAEARAETGLFHGVDTTLVGAARRAVLHSDEESRTGVEVLERALTRYREAIREAEVRLHPLNPGAALPPLRRALEELEEAIRRAPSPSVGPILRDVEALHATALAEALAWRRARLIEALLALSGVVVEARVDRPHLTGGSSGEVEVVVWNGGAEEVAVDHVFPGLPEGWEVTDDSPRLGSTVALNEGTPVFLGGAGNGEGEWASGDRMAVPAGELRSWRFRFEIPRGVEPTRLPFLAAPRDGSMYRRPAETELRGIPLRPPLITPEVTLHVGNSLPVEVRREAIHVYADKAYGELRLPVEVVPALSLRLEPSTMAWPMGRTEPLTVALRITNLSDAPLRGTADLVAPEGGWLVEGGNAGFTVEEGETTLLFRVRPSGTPSGGRVAFRAEVAAAGERFTEEVEIIDYPHMDPVPLFREAALHLSAFPVEVRDGLRVGYVEGPGDDGVRALRDLDIETHPLGEQELRFGDLRQFHTIVLGSRAYETRTDLMAANARVLDFARQGGTVVALYNKYEYPEGGFAPFTVEMARPHHRVTDPEAEVTFLEPGHPLLTSPNRLGPADFDGWVQERGLYFLSRWDPAFTPLLSMADPGEDPTEGSLVVARVGEGAYVYTGLALFRQLPAGVPGAYRLLANLVSLQARDLP